MLDRQEIKTEILSNISAIFFHVICYPLSPFPILFSRKISRARPDEHVSFTVPKEERSKEIKDEFNNLRHRKEESDGHVVRGSYGYTDALGLYRHVDYVADHNGFRANIRSNEPSMTNAASADITMVAEDPPRSYLTAASEVDSVVKPISASGRVKKTQAVFSPFDDSA